jgi:hypothetical protein
MPPPVYGAALEYLERKYGGVLDFTKRVVSTDTAALVELAQADPERVWLGFFETSGITQSLTPNSAATAGAAMRLGADEEKIFDVDKDALLPCLQWFGGIAGPGATVNVMEVRRVRISRGKE